VNGLRGQGVRNLNRSESNTFASKVNQHASAAAAAPSSASGPGEGLMRSLGLWWGVGQEEGGELLFGSAELTRTLRGVLGLSLGKRNLGEGPEKKVLGELQIR